MLTNLYVTLLARLEDARSEDDGQGLVEYGLILAFIAMVCIGAVQLLGGNINTLLSGISF